MAMDKLTKRVMQNFPFNISIDVYEIFGKIGLRLLKAFMYKYKNTV